MQTATMACLDGGRPPAGFSRTALMSMTPPPISGPSTTPYCDGSSTSSSRNAMSAPCPTNASPSRRRWPAPSDTTTSSSPACRMNGSPSPLSIIALPLDTASPKPSGPGCRTNATDEAAGMPSYRCASAARPARPCAPSLAGAPGSGARCPSTAPFDRPVTGQYSRTPCSQSPSNMTCRAGLSMTEGGGSRPRRGRPNRHRKQLLWHLPRHGMQPRARTGHRGQAPPRNHAAGRGKPQFRDAGIGRGRSGGNPKAVHRPPLAPAGDSWSAGGEVAASCSGRKRERGGHGPLLRLYVILGCSSDTAILLGGILRTQAPARVPALAKRTRSGGRGPPSCQTAHQAQAWLTTWSIFLYSGNKVLYGSTGSMRKNVCGAILAGRPDRGARGDPQARGGACHSSGERP